MKSLLIALMMVGGMTAQAAPEQFCEKLLVSASRQICTNEAARPGEPEREMLCRNAFLSHCRIALAHHASTGEAACIGIRRGTHRISCNLEFFEVERARGTSILPDAMRKLMDCQESFLRACAAEL